MRFFAQFLMLGMDKVGTQALVKGSQDFFALALKSLQQQILEAWNQQFVPFVFATNQIVGLTKLPEIIWADPGQVDINSIMSLYGQAITSGALHAIPEDEEHFRGLLDLPDTPAVSPRIPSLKTPL